jgi:hypothetical protein
MNKQTEEALRMAIEGLEQLLLFLYQEEETALYCNKFYEIQTAKKNIDECNKKINACKEALSEQEPAQEPVLIQWYDEETEEWEDTDESYYKHYEENGHKIRFLYTHPAQPLSDARIKEIADSLDIEDDYYDYNLARAIEQAHGIGVK